MSWRGSHSLAFPPTVGRTAKDGRAIPSMGSNTWGGKAVVFVFCFVSLTMHGSRAWAQTTNRQAPASPIRIIAIERTVEVSRVGSLEWDLAYTNQLLKAGDRIRTREGSRLTLLWSDQSTVRLGSMTEFEVAPPPQPKAQSGFSLFRGLAYFFHRDKPADVRVKTRTASAAVRGTEFNLEARDNDQTILTMVDGEVDFSNEQDTIRLRSGEQGIAEPGRAPRKTPQIVVMNVIQWCLYYPGVLDPDEVGLTSAEQQALAESLSAYRAGDLLEALDKYPAGRQPASPVERVYLAALLLAVGQVEQSVSILDSLEPAAGQPGAESALILSDALRQLIAAVKLQMWEPKRAPQLATEWLSESYYQQSQGHLPEALAAAR